MKARTPTAPGYASTPSKQAFTPSLFLQTSIDLLDHVLACVRLPISTCLIHDKRNPSVVNLLRLRQNVHVEPSAQVPRNVTCTGRQQRTLGMGLEDLQ